MKRFLFGLILLLISSCEAQGRPLQVPHLAVKQEEQPKPTTFFWVAEEGIPDEVKKVKNDSLVAVRAGIPHWEEEPGYHHDYFYGAGFVPAGFDGYVLTCFHVMGAYPGTWSSESYPLIIQVFDGHDTFEAKMVFFDPYKDLALLKITTPNPDKVEFAAKPAVIAQETFNEPAKKKLPDKFYAFSFFPENPAAFFIIQIGPMRMVTNLLNPTGFPLAIIQGGVEPGFSGGPLLAPDGVVMGMIVKSSVAFSRAVIVETINVFLKDYKLQEEGRTNAKAKEEKK